MPAPPGRSNRVLFTEELARFPNDAPRFYRFRLNSAPIELGRESSWRAFRQTFARVYYVSATLRVADGWDFVRRRLDLAAQDVDAIALDYPFDAATQAELVCFEDFPSWAEQEEAAIRSVAHHLAGYAAEFVRGDQNGAMVLTT